MSFIDPKTLSFLVTILVVIQYALGMIAALLALFEALYEDKIPGIKAWVKKYWRKIKNSPLRRLTENAVAMFLKILVMIAVNSFGRLPTWLLEPSLLVVGLSVAILLNQSLMIILFITSIALYVFYLGFIKAPYGVKRIRILMELLQFEQDSMNAQDQRSQTKNVIQSYLKDRDVSFGSLITVTCLAGFCRPLVFIASAISLVYVTILAAESTPILSAVLSMFLILVYFSLGIRFATLPIFLIMKYYYPLVVEDIERNFSFRDLKNLPDLFGKNGRYHDVFVVYVLLSITIAMIFVSVPITLLGLSLGGITSSEVLTSSVLQIFAVNMVFDSVTFFVTGMLVLTAVRLQKLKLYPLFLVCDLVSSAFFAVMSLYFSLLGTVHQLGMVDCARILLGYLPDKDVVSFTPQFWIMHTAFIPTSIYLGILFLIWTSNLFIEAFARFVEINTVADRNPLKVTAAFLGAGVVAIQGIREFVL